MAGSSILHYEILDIIGQGCMGIVYKAKDTRLERLVAIKSLSRHIAADSEVQERFKIEAKAAAVLNHPNIATVYSIEHVNRDYFIIMEFIDGKELREIIHEIPPGSPLKKGEENQSPPFVKGGQGGFLPLDDVLTYATQIAQGLCAAYENGVVHRDIKPANIMVTKKGQVKITDFGLAKLVGGALLTQVGTTVGTAAYMSPEQSQGEAVDHRTDIWALGAVLYEMVTGQRPFQGEYQQAVVYSILNEDPRPVSQLRADTPMHLQKIINKALAKAADNRYQKPDEMLKDLSSLAGELKTTGSDIGEPPAYPSETEKKAGVLESTTKNLPAKRLLWASLIAVMLMAAIAIGYFVRQQHAKTSREADFQVPGRVEHSQLIQQLSSISNTSAFMQRINEYSQAMRIAVGNRHDFDSIEDCYVFVMDEEYVRAGFQFRRNYFYDLLSNEKIESLEKKYVGHTSVWLRDLSR